MKCEYCGKEIPFGQESVVIGMQNLDDFEKIKIVKTHVYCEECFEELIPSFHKWLNTSQSPSPLNDRHSKEIKKTD